jgi:hypothetical protein
MPHKTGSWYAVCIHQHGVLDNLQNAWPVCAVGWRHSMVAPSVPSLVRRSRCSWCALALRESPPAADERALTGGERVARGFAGRPVRAPRGEVDVLARRSNGIGESDGGGMSGRPASGAGSGDSVTAPGGRYGIVNDGGGERILVVDGGRVLIAEGERESKTVTVNEGDPCGSTSIVTGETSGVVNGFASQGKESTWSTLDDCTDSFSASSGRDGGGGGGGDDALSNPIAVGS